MADEKLLDRIRKLLSLAEDQAGTPEGQRATELAEELMVRHGIEQALLAQKGATSDICARHIFVPAPYAREKALLLGAVAHYNQARSIVHTPRSWSRGCTVSVYGYPSDLERVEVLHTSLCLQAVRCMAARSKPLGEDLATWRTSWLIGFRHGVISRLYELHSRVQSETSGAELAVRDRSAAVEQHVAELYPDSQSMRQSRSSGSGGEDGFEAGRRALEQERVAPARREALSG